MIIVFKNYLFSDRWLKSNVFVAKKIFHKHKFHYSDEFICDVTFRQVRSLTKVFNGMVCIVIKKRSRKTANIVTVYTAFCTNNIQNIVVTFVSNKARDLLFTTV